MTPDHAAQAREIVERFYDVAPDEFWVASLASAITVALADAHAAGVAQERARAANAAGLIRRLAEQLMPAVGHEERLHLLLIVESAAAIRAGEGAGA